MFEGGIQFEAAPTHELGDLDYRNLVASRHLSRGIQDRSAIYGDAIVGHQRMCFLDRAGQTCRHQCAIDPLGMRHELRARGCAEYTVRERRKIGEHSVRSNGAIVGCFADARQHESKLGSD